MVTIFLLLFAIFSKLLQCYYNVVVNNLVYIVNNILLNTMLITFFYNVNHVNNIVYKIIVYNKNVYNVNNIFLQYCFVALLQCKVLFSHCYNVKMWF